MTGAKDFPTFNIEKKPTLKNQDNNLRFKAVDFEVEDLTYQLSLHQFRHHFADRSKKQDCTVAVQSAADCLARPEISSIMPLIIAQTQYLVWIQVNNYNTLTSNLNGQTSEFLKNFFMEIHIYYISFIISLFPVNLFLTPVDDPPYCIMLTVKTTFDSLSMEKSQN